MFQEFKAFVNQGNAIDLAVGVVVGAAFGKIVNSMFVALNGNSYPNVEAALADKAPVLAYGVFINTIVEFFIVAFSIFLVVKQVNRWRGPAPKKA